jgi:DNA-binding XRE family transcriptional regulator
MLKGEYKMNPTLKEARARYGLTQAQLGDMLGVSKTIIVFIENGSIAPKPIHRQRLLKMFGPLRFTKDEEDFSMNNVPQMPKALWTNEGRPDFSHLELESTKGVADQLHQLLSELHAMDASRGEYLHIDEVGPSSCVARFQLAGGYKLYRAKFKVVDDEVSLDGAPVEIKDTTTLQALAKKRTVPKMPIARWKPTGQPDYSDLE